MKKIEKMALKEIERNSGNVRMQLDAAKTHLLSIKQTLMHCDPNLSKECKTELIAAACKAINEIEKSEAANSLMGDWAESIPSA